MVTYHEHILKKKKTGKDFAFCLAIPFVMAFAALILSFIVLAVIPFLSMLFPLVVVGSIYLAYKIIANRNVEFEYLLVDSDLDIDKIMNKTKRKRIVSVYRKEIIAMAPAGSSNLPDNWQNLDKIDASSSMDSPDTFVLVFTQDGIQKALYFCPTENMIETMIIRNPRKVFRD